MHPTSVAARDWTDVLGLHWRDLGNWGTAVLVAAAVLTVAFAWRTVREGKDASEKLGTVVTNLESLLIAVADSTAAAQQTVAELEKVTAAAQETAVSSDRAAEAARETVEISAAAREADREYRQLEQLRTIGRLVEDILTDSSQAVVNIPSHINATWRSPVQNLLKTVLVGVTPDLPKCRALVGESQAGQVRAAALNAQFELNEVFQHLEATQDG